MLSRLRDLAELGAHAAARAVDRSERYAACWRTWSGGGVRRPVVVTGRGATASGERGVPAVVEHRVVHVVLEVEPAGHARERAGPRACGDRVLAAPVDLDGEVRLVLALEP